MADQYHHGNLKSKLLEEAVTLISQDGLENLSLRRLATQCGVSHNAIYRHFDSKERLIDACRAYVMQELTRTLELTLSGLDESLPQTMEQLGTAYLDFYMRNPTYFSAYFRNASQKLTFSLEPIEGNYPPFSVFRRVAVAIAEKQGIPQDETRWRLLRYWTMLNGMFAMWISSNVELPENWKTCLKTILRSVYDMKQIILTGDRPTGNLHVGHYVGSLAERVKLQNSGKYDEIYIMIADAQALTDNAEHPERVRQNIMKVALDYLAVGIDPEKSNIFIQSMVPQLTELTFYYMNLVTVSRVQRNPTVKAEIQMRNFEASIPVGFFCYPISQAADITAFNATAVPVGEDQEPMLEQCREIVHKFNTVYGETLTMPQIVLPSNNACMRLPGTDGKAKMSKSLGNCIYLADPEEVVREKIMSMYTDPDHIRVQDPGKLEGNTVFTYLDAFCQPEHFAEFLPDYQSLDELKAHYQRGGLGDVKVKKFLNNVMQSLLSPMRERRAQWEGRLPEVYEILKKGSEIAAETAQGTLDRVRHAMKIDYFTDNGLLK